MADSSLSPGHRDISSYSSKLSQPSPDDVGNLAGPRAVGPANCASSTDLGLAVPVWLRAAAAVHGGGDGTARVRLRTRRVRGWSATPPACARPACPPGR
jgi:hypothetical protein